MRVTRAKIYLVEIGTLRPVIVELATDEGITGVGEAGMAYGLGGTAAAGMIKDLSEALILGQDPFRVEALWTEMYDHSFWAKGGGPVVFAGIGAIEQALLDIKAKALGIALYELLGGKFRDRVRTYANGWSYDCVAADDYARAAERVVGDGYTALKFYPLATPNGRGGIRHVSRRSVDRAFMENAVEKVKAVRHAVGNAVDILIDLSGGLTTDETIRLCAKLGEFDILFVEEPADPFDLGALKKISDHIEIPIAVGERIYTRNGFRPVLESRAADILQPDIGNTGGILEAKKIAAMAETYSMRMQPHVCGSPVATAAALQLGASIPNLIIHEIYPYRPPEHFQIVDHAPELDVCDGHLPVPCRPGIGVTLVDDRMPPFLWAETVLR